MSRPCTVCFHADREEIDAALAAGMPCPRLAAQFALSESALWRHRASHLADPVGAAPPTASPVDSAALLDQAGVLQAATLTALHRAEAAGDVRAILAAVRTARGNLALVARLLGQLP